MGAPSASFGAAAVDCRAVHVKQDYTAGKALQQQWRRRRQQQQQQQQQKEAAITWRLGLASLPGWVGAGLCPQLRSGLTVADGLEEREGGASKLTQGRARV
jgi:hypothetical protein